MLTQSNARLALSTFGNRADSVLKIRYFWTIDSTLEALVSFAQVEPKGLPGRVANPVADQQ